MKYKSQDLRKSLMIIQLEGEKMLVENNTVVAVHYHGYFLDTKEVFDSSLEREPLTFLVGHGQMIPGFEAEVLGAEMGEKRTFTLEPERAYGHREEERVMAMPIGDFPEEIELPTSEILTQEPGKKPTLGADGRMPPRAPKKPKKKKIRNR